MEGNKICITKRGTIFCREEKEEMLNSQQSIWRSRKSSLPTLSIPTSRVTEKSIVRKQSQNKKLSTLTSTLTKLQNIGLKKMAREEEEHKFVQALQQQMKEKNRYLKTIIPQLVKRTRDSKLGDLNTRLMRSRVYTEKLIARDSLNKNFGITFHKKKVCSLTENTN